MRGAQLFATSSTLIKGTTHLWRPALKFMPKRLARRCAAQLSSMALASGLVNMGLGAGVLALAAVATLLTVIPGLDTDWSFESQLAKGGAVHLPSP